MTQSLFNTLHRVSDMLTELRTQIQSETRAGLTSRNKVAEHVLLTVLRHVYDAPDLANANARGPNHPGIDLFDESTGLGVQITSDTSSGKITDTIDVIVRQGTLAEPGLQLRRLAIALIADRKPAYRAKTRLDWAGRVGEAFAFDPAEDVFAFDSLLHRIQSLAPARINEIATELEALVQGKHRVHLLPHLHELVDRQLAEEKRLARYIPDVFVETQSTKYQARCFGHPGLFVRRIAGYFDRQPLAHLNSLSAMSGLPLMDTPPTRRLGSADTPQEAAAEAESFISDLQRLDTALEAFAQVSAEGASSLLGDAARAYVLDETKYYLRDAARRAQWRVRDRSTELACVSARVFLLTGPAGQGKTNFLCDFVERFLVCHEVPCAYVTARQLGRTANPSLAEAVRNLIFPPEVQTLHEGLKALEPACAERKQPFMLVIDGLNEHPDVRAFAGQLGDLLETLVAYPHVRVLLSCRSEFLRDRFGSLLSGALMPVLHLSEAHGQSFGEDEYRELVAKYFRFFEVNEELVTSNVIDVLRRDILLLRLFCEAYGARDRDDTYRQPYVRAIYRGEIFRTYVEEKLGRADGAIFWDRSSSRPLANRPKTRRVLALVAAHMLTTGHFSDVPRSAVPADLDVELTALIDEDLVLRRDLAPAPSVLTEATELLNFTFDEMRDFMLAQYLLALYDSEPDECWRLINAQEPRQAQSIEGIRRFLFYASREPEGAMFLDAYRAHPWYSAVYDQEVFSIPPAYFGDDDARVIEHALLAGGTRARNFARQLAVRWRSSVEGILNLELLLQVAAREREPFFVDVIIPVFADAPYGEQSLCDSVCYFVEEEVLARFVPEREHPYDPLFRLLVLLLPVRATPSLDSPAFRALRALIRGFPAYAAELLVRELPAAGEVHRAFLWRLLYEVTLVVDDEARLAALARADVQNAQVCAPLRVQAERFLSRLGDRRDG